jgi:hypothetical protein
MSSYFDAIFTGELGTKIATLTILTFALPVLQSIVCCVLMILHPRIPEYTDGTKHTLKYVGDNFKNMAKYLLSEHGFKPKNPERIRTWLSSVTEINANQYSEASKAALRAHYVGTRRDKMEEVDGRMSLMLAFDPCNPPTAPNETAATADQTADQEQTAAEQNDQEDVQSWIPNGPVTLEDTPSKSERLTLMMKIINCHIQNDGWIAFMQQINLGMAISPRTKKKKNTMSFRGVIDILQQQSEPTFPQALQFSIVLSLKDIPWNYQEMGTRLSPIDLANKPWPSLKTDANKYIRSFLLDVWLHWISIFWIGVVLLGVIFAE